MQRLNSQQFGHGIYRKLVPEQASQLVGELRNLGFLYEHEPREGEFYRATAEALQIRIKSDMSLQTNDFDALGLVLEGKYPFRAQEGIIQIDDSGTGCPFGGVSIGAFDTMAGEMAFRRVPLKYFQEPYYASKGVGEHLDVISRAARGLVNELGASPERNSVQICPGVVLCKAKHDLRQEGFDVQIANIGKPFQQALVRSHRQYLLEVGAPEDGTPEAVAEWAERNGRGLLKKPSETNKLYIEG